MAMTFSSDYIYVIAMLKTTPLVVTVGLSLTIPLAIVGDLFLGRSIALQAIFGGCLVLVSFVVVGIENSKTKAVPVAEYSDDLDLVDEAAVDGLDGEGVDERDDA